MVNQEWNLIPKEGMLKCNRGHALKLCPYPSCDGWIGRCSKTFRGRIKGKCNFRRSFRKGTFFDKSHLPIYKILVFVFMWTKRTGGLNDIIDEISIGLRAAVDWNNFCREVCIHSSFQTQIEIGGPGKIVEIYETKVGKRKFHRGHHVEGQWAFGGVERGSNNSFMFPVEDRTRDTLLPLIKKYIKPESIIISDCWRAYKTLSKEEYTHHQVNHSENFVDPQTGYHTNTMEGLWRHLKRSVPEYNPGQLYDPTKSLADSEFEKPRMDPSSSNVLLESGSTSEESQESKADTEISSEDEYPNKNSTAESEDEPPAKKLKI
ncbi:uncharacterized protein [Musca autumnalis]|uniref:uncharacterized protein n=1 Tax=Musca autumnalis TaxID=221902 RepID=UPI003CE8853A